MEKRFQYAKQLAKEAGKELLRFFRKNIKIEKKGIIDLVTEADKKAESYLLGSLFKLYPEDSILVEESGIIDNNSKIKWIIDPLDGTTNFAQGFEMFCVSIGLEFEGEIIFGVVYLPVLDDLYYAFKNQGAYLNGERIFVSQKTDLIDCVIATGFPYSKITNSDNNLKEHNEIILKCRDLRRCGSAAVDLVYTARGIWDCYWEKHLKPWDIAGGSIIVKESGGKIIGMDNNPLNIYNGSIIAGNEKIVNELLNIFNNNN